MPFANLPLGVQPMGNQMHFLDSTKVLKADKWDNNHLKYTIKHAFQAGAFNHSATSPV